LTRAESTRRRIVVTAARVFCERGYAASGMEDVARACGLTKAGLYHHIRSKEQLLFEIQSYGMDVFEEQVLRPAAEHAHPLRRLEDCLERNVLLLTKRRSQEIAVILHEHNTLKGDARARINARKKRYVRFLEQAFREAMRRRLIRRVNPRVAAFSFLGMVLWIYKWFRSDGVLSPERLAREMRTLFFDGLALETQPRRARP
jgi:AcrR family transcriptional regulator